MISQNEREQYAVIAECYRRCRRENDRLREILKIVSPEIMRFDREDQEVFSLVKKNRQQKEVSSDEE